MAPPLLSSDKENAPPPPPPSVGAAKAAAGFGGPSFPRPLPRRSSLSVRLDGGAAAVGGGGGGVRRKSVSFASAAAVRLFDRHDAAATAALQLQQSAERSPTTAPPPQQSDDASMELTALVHCAAETDVQQQQQQGGEEEAMQLTALLPAGLPSLYSAAQSAVAVLRAHGQREEQQQREEEDEEDGEEEQGQQDEQREVRCEDDDQHPGEQRSPAAAATGPATAPPASPAPPPGPRSSLSPWAGAAMAAAPPSPSPSVSMELTALLPGVGDGADADADADMDVTAILERWSARQSSGEDGLLGDAVAEPSEPSATPLSASPSPRPSLRRLSQRLSLSASSRGTSSSPTRVSLGEKTALLAARWEEIMEEQQQPDTADSGASEPTRSQAPEPSTSLRPSSAAAAPDMGEATASIYAMLQAVLMDGQSAAEAVHNARSRDCGPQHDEAGAQAPATPQPPRSPPSPRSPSPLLSPVPPSLGSPAAAAGVSASSSLSLSTPRSSASSALGGGWGLARLFHLLDLPSLDEAHLTSRLRKRDSSFQGRPAIDAPGNEGDADADAGAEAAALRRCLVLLPTVESLQAACVHLLDANAQIKEQIAHSQTQLADAVQADGQPLLGGANPLHALLRGLSAAGQSEQGMEATEDGSVALPPSLAALASPALRALVGSFFAHCTRLSRLTWVRWHRQLSELLEVKVDEAAQQLSNDRDMTADLRHMQVALAALWDGGLQKPQQRMARAELRRCRLEHARLQQEHDAAQARLQQQQQEQGRISHRLQSVSAALPRLGTALIVQHQHRRRARSLRSLLSTQSFLTSGAVVEAKEAVVGVQLHGVAALHCAVKGGDGCAGALRQLTVTCECISSKRPSPSSPSPALCPVLVSAVLPRLSALQRRADEGTGSSEGLSLALRRCASLLHRASQWQQSAEEALRGGRGRVLASWALPQHPSASEGVGADVVLSLRVLSPDRRVQVVCRCWVSLDVEPRESSSVLRSTVRVNSTDGDIPTAALEQRLLEWMRNGRTRGYGPVQRMSKRMEAELADV